MAHNLNIVGGKAALYSLRENPWHGLGQVVERPVTDDEALKLAGLDWQVELQPLYRSDMVPVETHVATIRSDTKTSLGVVGKGYTPVQNEELFTWLRGLDGFADVTIETAGALGDGETVWVQARCDGLKFDLGDGGIQAYMLLSNGHAGNRRMIIMGTGQRVVCQNTLRMADGGKAGSTNKGTLSTGWALRHTTNVAKAMEAIQDAYKRTTDGWKASEEALRFLATKPISEAKLQRLFVEPWIPKPVTAEAKAEAEAAAAETQDESTRAATIRMTREKRLREILASPTCAIGKLGDTLYAGLQAVTEFVDHESAVRGKNEALARLESSSFGGVGDEIKGKAWKLALELAEA